MAACNARSYACEASRIWGGPFRVEPGARTGIHHHEEQHTIVYILSGSSYVRWGERGEFNATAQAGDFLYAPAWLPHQEINPSRGAPNTNDRATDHLQPFSTGASSQRLNHDERLRLLFTASKATGQLESCRDGQDEKAADCGRVSGLILIVGFCGVERFDRIR